MKSLSLLMITGCLFSIGTDVYASALPGDPGYSQDQDSVQLADFGISKTGDQSVEGTYVSAPQQDSSEDVYAIGALLARMLTGEGGPLQTADMDNIVHFMHDEGVLPGRYNIISVNIEEEYFNIEEESELKQMAQEFVRVLKDDDVDALKDLMARPDGDELSNLRFRVSVNRYNEITLYQNGTGTVEQGDCPERIEKLFRYSFINPLELSMVFGAIGCFKHLRINDINTGNITDRDRQRMGFALAIGKDTEIIQIALEQGLVYLKDLLFGWARSVPNLILFNNGLTTIEGLSGAMSYVMAKDKDYSDWITSTVIEEVGIDATDCDGWTPLMHAISGGNSEAVRLLIERRADVNARNQRGTTPLTLATGHKQSDIVELLIEKGADVNLPVVRTPLMVATERGYTDIARLLIERGADVNVRDRWGKTPLSIALRNCQPEIVRLLEAQLALDSALITAIKGGDINIVRGLLEKGANVNATDGFRTTPLMYALEYRQPEIAKLLIQSNADVNTLNRNGITPLMLALEHNHPDIARLLIERRADATPEQIKTLEANKAPPPAE